MIASLKETLVAIDCEDSEEVEYKALGKDSVQVLVTKSDQNG